MATEIKIKLSEVKPGDAVFDHSSGDWVKVCETIQLLHGRTKLVVHREDFEALGSIEVLVRR